MRRKIYQQLLDWKEKRNGEVALLVEGARRIGKSYIVEEFFVFPNEVYEEVWGVYEYPYCFAYS